MALVLELIFRKFQFLKIEKIVYIIAQKVRFLTLVDFSIAINVISIRWSLVETILIALVVTSIPTVRYSAFYCLKKSSVA